MQNVMAWPAACSVDWTQGIGEYQALPPGGLALVEEL